MPNSIESSSGPLAIGAGRERRAGTRLYVGWSATLQLPDSLALVPGKVSDVSIGGGAFVSVRPLKAGTHCTLSIDLPNLAGTGMSHTSVAVVVLNSLATHDGSRQYRANLSFGVLPGNLRSVLETQLRKLS